jgi:uncharacterized protein YifE (UPF0438 family)
MSKIIALNSKHQSVVNKAISWLQKYNTANDQRDLASDSNEKDFDDECKTWRKYDRLCEKTWDKYTDYISELPQREVNQIEKSEIY